MRLLVALPYVAWPPVGGAPVRSWHLLKHLAGRHQVHVLSVVPAESETRVPKGAPNAPPVSFASTTLVRVPSGNPPRLSPAWAALRVRSLRHPAAAYYRGSAARTFRDLVARLRPDAVVYGFSWMLPYAAHAPGTPAVADEHNYDPLVTARIAAGRRGPDRWKWKVYERVTSLAEARNLRPVRGIAAVSDEDAGWFRRIAPHATVDVVPNGVDVQAFAPAELGTAVVMTGSFTYQPNVDAARRLAHRIWPLVRREVPSAELRIAGLGSERALADLAGLAGVTVVGWVDDMRTELLGARVAVAPLDVGGGTRIKILEAFALARPVVATTLGAEGLKVRSDEHLVLRDDDAGFAAAVARLLRDSAWAATLGRNGRALVETLYDWRLSAQRFEDLVRRVAA